jgi:EAL domain-containing protein (putative c-di-GMP-specific phosphodiesterase class I)
LKIDQSFVADLGSQDGRALVDAIIALASTLNLLVVAEGVETLKQAQYLLDHDCQLLQGYYFSRPMPVSEIAALLDTDFSDAFQQDRSA